MPRTLIHYRTEAGIDYAVVPNIFLQDFISWLSDAEILFQRQADNEAIALPMAWPDYQTCLDYVGKVELCMER